MLTTALWFLYLSFRPRQPEEPVEPAAKAIADPLVAAQPEKPSDPQAEINEASDPDDLDAADPAAAPPEFSAETVTLGSMDPSKNFQLQVTLTSTGAALERVELVERESNGQFRYRSLENEGGYLGYLKLSADGTIRNVPDGSAAALATSSSASGGLVVGDQLIEVGGQTLGLGLTLEQALKKTKAGDSVELTVVRDGKTVNYTAILTEAPLDILRTRRREAGIVEGNAPVPSLRTTVNSIDGKYIPVGLPAFPSLQGTLDANWQVSELEVPGGQGVEFRLPLAGYLAASSGPKDLELVKRFRLFPKSESNDGYLLDVETLIANQGDTPVRLSVRQEGLNGLSLEGWWFSVKISPAMFAAAGARDIAYFTEARNHQLESTRSVQQYATKHPTQPNKILFAEGEPVESRTLKYIGVDAQYFNASLLEHPDAPGALTDLRQAAAIPLADVENIHKNKKQATNIGFWFDTLEKEIAAGQELSQRYQVFIGPKDAELLSAHGLDKTIEYGWFPWVAKPLSFILHLFHNIVRNYGIAIVMLTLVVRSLLFPLTRKAMINSQKMQERMQVLQPEMKKINEKYKDDFQKRSKAIQDLYAKHNFNPAENLAGCLPMFIQIPIFIGLYRCLSVDVALRQEPLIPGLSWCSNLAGPDQLYNWSSWMPEFIAGKGTGWLGPYFNLLPILTVVLFILQQKMLMPPAQDEQQRMTQTMMKYMTAFMGVLFFKVPAGLCIYFITSSVWSIVERKLIKRSTPATDTAAAAGTGSSDSNGQQTKEKPGRKRNRNQAEEESKPSRMQEIRDLLDKPAQKSTTHRNTSKKPPASKRAGKKGKKRR